jgi:hypothetical protein
MPSIAEIILASGRSRAESVRQAAQIEADRRRQSGAIWGNAVNQIGQQVSSGIQAHQEEKRQAPMRALELKNAQQRVDMNEGTLQDADRQRRAALAKDRETWLIKQVQGPSLEQGEDGFPRYSPKLIAENLTKAGRPDLIQQAVKDVTEHNKYVMEFRQAQVNALGTMAAGMKNLGIHTNLEAVINNVKLLGTQGLISPTEAQRTIKRIQADPSQLTQSIDELIAVSEAGQKLVKEPKFTNVPAGSTMVNEQTQEPVFTAPKPTQYQESKFRLNGRDVVGAFDPATAKYFYNGQDVTAQVTQTPPASLRVSVSPEAAANRQDTARQLVAGNIVPSMLSKRGADYNALLAEANKISIAETGKPINLVKLETEYRAAQRWATTQNSAQAQRFYGLAESVVSTIDEVKTLAEELKQGGLQLWNKAKRNTIQQIYGNTPQSELAARYIGAVNTLKEEFANLANGGYAPTESAWALANSQIQTDFGFKDMLASLTEVQRLINFRVNAFQTVAIRSPFGGNVGVDQSTPQRPPGVPANAVYDPATKEWVIR